MVTMPPAVKIALGVLGGWLAIMAPAVVTIALRLQEFDVSGLPSTYALILSLGWLTMMVALVVSGAVGDVVRARTGSRVLLARIGAPLILVGGVLLAIAPSPGWLMLTWVLVQIPSAMVVTTALAESGDEVSRDRRGITSGWVGAAPIIALLVGSVAVRFLADALAWAFIVPAVLGALLATPLMRRQQVMKSVEEEVSAARGVIGPGLLPLWIAFLVGSFLLSWSTSTTNGFMVTFVQYGIETDADQVADATTGLIIIATSLAVIASVLAGAWSRGRPRAVRLWVVAAVLCAVALGLLVVAPNSVTLVLAAMLFGTAFGMANGVELAVVLLVRRDPATLGRDLGVFTAVTSAPYVLVPALATVLLDVDARSGAFLLFQLACFTAFVGGLVFLISAGRHRSRQLLAQ